MIPRSTAPSTPQAAGTGRAAWQRELAAAVRDPLRLLEMLGLDAADVRATLLGDDAAARVAAVQFPLLVPRGFVARMRRGDAADPLLRQVLAVGAESAPAAGYGLDPLAERGSGPLPGVLHKYRGRALLVVTGACAVHCRYCFRRHFPYAGEALNTGAWDAAVDYLAGDPSIHEVILSGGDPLTLTDGRLAELARRLAAVPHLRRLRVHSRLPVVLPERVDEALLAWLAGGRLQPVMVIHANHGREIDTAVAAAVGRLRDAGVPVLNQTVMLAGVNDSVEALADLSERLFAAGALPYYLHQLDPVAGAAHFAVADDHAAALVAELAARLPGYLVPRLVREVPGAQSKVALAVPPLAETAPRPGP
jgi:EF-P beta-lysylation protein EpmB